MTLVRFISLYPLLIKLLYSAIYRYKSLELSNPSAEKALNLLRKVGEGPVQDKIESLYSTDL